MDKSSLLKSVTKPARYSGGEYGQTVKYKNAVKLRVAFCFPDAYEIGMCNLGMRILYGVLNEEEDIWCERVFAPWVDMEEKMRALGIKLFAHESGDEVKDFGIAAFTMQYELCYSNILNMLELAGIPLLAKDRGEDFPIILGGGPCAYNPEPMAEFFDIFCIGEGEEAIVELARLYISMKEDGSYTKEAFLRAAAGLEGFYVPSLYSVGYNEDGTLSYFKPKYDFVPAKVKKRIIKDIDKAYVPLKTYVPFTETVQDRIILEINRGCIRGCRFCQAGSVCRPIREKSPQVLNEQAKELYKNTGYDEIVLCSLSVSDYSRIRDLTDNLLEWTDREMVNLSLPSLRIDSFTEELMQRVSSVRAAGLTFAPEAGTQRLRDVINKNVTEEDLLRAVNVAFSSGKSSVKLYFMNGLPTETDEDIIGIARLAEKVIDAFYRNPDRNRRKPPSVTISVACFVPKPFTPFQWEAQDTSESLERKQALLRAEIKDRKIRYTYHEAKTSYLEAVFARGDRRLAPVLLKAREKGLRFDAWDEFFSYDKWQECFKECGIDGSFYALREIDENELLPWDFIDIGVTKEHLKKERQRAYESKTTPSCREECAGCGAARLGGCDCLK